MSRTIDAHQHFWQRGRFKGDVWLDEPKHKPISGSFLPEDLAPLLHWNGIDGSVFVQTQHDVDENRWALDFAKKHPFILGVVGWVDLASPKCEEQLLEFKDNPKFVGIRHITQGEADDDFIVRDDVVRGLKVLEKHDVPFDLLFYVKHLKHAATLAKKLPNLRMVIDHLAKPRIKDQVVAGWIDDLKAAAKFPNVSCKLSGMVTEADWKSWKPADLKPYVDAALEAFGPDRCMFGSDWPVCLLAALYPNVFGALKELIATLGAAERAKILGGSAEKFYGLR
ncbi:MAG TPA: amidohydrolase family protein [Planctomycetota bacterium]|nr:amidohydrolase family protein [Planctomycetota bacterium]